MIWEELNPEMIITGLEASDSTDVLTRVGRIVIHAGYAKETYVDALIKREKDYPTGLDIDGQGVAIPHTDVSHVLKEGIAIAVLNKPVTFLQMGTDDEPVEVQLVFMLSVVDPSSHIEQLQRILEIIQDKAVLEKILELKDAQEIINVVREKENTL